MSGPQSIIIRRVQINDPGKLPVASQRRLQELAAADKAGSSLTLPQKLYVAYQALRSLHR